MKSKFVFRPRIECNNGFSLSVQASSNHYCTPRTDEGPWEEVEVGYITNKKGTPYTSEELKKASGNYEPSGDEQEVDVYAYTPVKAVSDFIEANGGVSEKSLGKIFWN